jgi:hypothetical protein
VERAVKGLLPFVVIGALATPAAAESLQVQGHAGFLGEWELTANVSRIASGGQQFSGPLTMEHVGLCTQDGPERKTGEIRIQMSGSSRLKATLLLDGVECTYSGKLGDTFAGMMSCPDRRAVPLKLWLK